MTIIDAHSHLWLKQDTWVDGKRILSMKNGRSIFMDEEVQMMPPFMTDEANTAEIFLSNMNYAQVGGTVVVQEVIDGNQNAYLTEVQRKYPDRFFCMGMALSQTDEGMVWTLDVGEDEHQIGEMREVIEECPELKVAIGHFGMVTTPAFKSQVMLARAGKNVMVESGGITWLYNAEFYPYPSAIRSIKEAAEWVGMDKLMWGSDYPRTITAITYKMSYDFVCKSKELTNEEKTLFLGQNALHFYGFKNLPELPYIKNMSE